MKLRHPRLIGCLISLLLLLTLPELMLQLFDPWRVRPYFADLDALWTHTDPDAARGYVLTVGTFQYSNWSMSVNADHTRRVPDTSETNCRIVFLGDSVTMGHGVQDSETWVNQLAQQYPAVHLINAGTEGYNAEQVHATRRLIRASGYLYLLISNDADPRLHPDRQPQPAPLYAPLLPLYWYVWETRHPGSGTNAPPDYGAFDTALAALKADPRVTIVGLAGDPLAQRADVPTIPRWTHSNSTVDTHANAAGNSELASALKPYVDHLLKKDCP